MSNYRDSEYIENPELVPYGLAAVIRKEQAGKAPKKARAQKASPAHTALALDIVAAVANAGLAVHNIPDGGTCNLDSVALRIRFSAGLEAVCKAMGIHLDRTHRASTYNVIGGARVGQGQRATKFCELVAAELKGKGHDAYVIYYTD